MVRNTNPHIAPIRLPLASAHGTLRTIAEFVYPSEGEFDVSRDILSWRNGSFAALNLVPAVFWCECYCGSFCDGAME